LLEVTDWKEEMDMKKVTACSQLFLLIFFIPMISWATVYVDEGFEGGTFDTTPVGICYGAPECTCSSGETTCQCSGGTNYARIQSDVKHSGTRALKVFLNDPGGAGALIDPAYYTSPNWTSKTALYLRFYIYYDSAYRWYNRNKMIVWRIANAPDLYINCNGVTWPWSESNGSATCDVGVYFGMSPSNSCGSLSPWKNDEFYYVAKSSGANKGQSWLVAPGGWYYFEIFVDTVNRSLSFWMQRPGDPSPTLIIDKKSLVGCSNMDGSGGEYFQGIEADGFINDISGPSGGIFYIDDIKIADTYMGPINSAELPISAPTGLKTVTGQ
jgi:hypothetical protein